MKKILFVAVVALVVITMAGGAYAAGPTFVTPTVVSATVTGKCSIATDTASALAFPALDPELTNGANAVPTGDAAIKCSNGFTYTVMAAVGNNAGGTNAAADCSGGLSAFMNDGAGNYLNYTFTCTNPGAGSGFGAAAVSLTPAASIDMTTQRDAVAAIYSDSVILSVFY